MPFGLELICLDFLFHLFDACFLIYTCTYSGLLLFNDEDDDDHYLYYFLLLFYKPMLNTPSA